MRKPLVKISSGLVLAIGLTTPAWAQLGRGGLGAGAGASEHGAMDMGHSGVSTSSSERLGVDARTNQPDSVKGSTDVSGSTKAQVKADKKAKVNANAEAGASAHAKVKKQKHGKDNQQTLQVKSDTNANVNANTGAKVDASGHTDTSVH